MMFVILVYDVNAKRDSKVKKICERYLYHIQKSVFEGTIAQAKLDKLKDQLVKILDPETDQCTIYKLESLKFTAKDELGRVGNPTNII